MIDIIIPINLRKKVRLSPAVWPNSNLKVQPGNLALFAPMGNGLYGHQKPAGLDPFADAPPQDPCGGVIYFDNEISKTDFEALARIWEIEPGNPERAKQYAAFTAESGQPGQDGYLVQMRIVPAFGLNCLYHAINNTAYERFPNQAITITEALWLFIEKERERWGTSFRQDEEKGLRGLFGGDGDYVREKLSFGFMLENAYYGICRIWSRAWLVTK